MRALVAGLLFSLASCATPATPYTTEFPIGDWSGDLFGDGLPKSLWITNPTALELHVDVVCISEHTMPFEVDLAGGATERVLIQVLNRDQFINDCSVTRWRTIGPDHPRHATRPAPRAR